MKFTSFFFWGALIGLMGCGPAGPIEIVDDVDMAGRADATGEVVMDDRVEKLPPDDGFVDLYTPDVIIHPGEDKNLCVHVSYDGEETGIRELDVVQGETGHHVLLMTMDRKQPEGTLEDCDDPGVLRRLRPVMYPVDGGLPGADDGARAIRLTKDMPLVLHFHHVNTKPVPVLVRDRARLTKIHPKNVTHWVSAMALASFDFELPPRAESTVAFDCTVPRDFDLLLIGGHMHESGKRFSISNLNPISLNLGSGGQEQKIPEQETGPVYSVDKWEPYFRDAPKIEPLFNRPRRLMKSSLLRVHCTWENQTAEKMVFPTEMCAVFGYIQEVAAEAPHGVSTTPLPGNTPPNEQFYCEAKSTTVQGAPL